MTTASDAGRPQIEQLLRQLRDGTHDRDAVRRAFAEVLIAHGIAEEDLVYPVLRRRAEDVGAHEIHHGYEERTEDNEALLAVLELKGTDSQAFSGAVEKLSNRAPKSANGHAPSSVGTGPRDATSSSIRGCGTTQHVRRIVREATDEGLLDEDE